MFTQKSPVALLTMKGQTGHANGMYHTKVRTRPLGAVRKSSGSSIESVPKFPPLTPVIDRSYQGIAGNALQVPPPRETPDRTEPEPVPSKPSMPSPRKASDSSKSVDSVNIVSEKNDAKAKQLKEAMTREVQLKQQIMQLQKVIDDLRMQVKDKQKTIDNLQQQFMRQEEKYKELYEKEQVRHSETKDKLKQTEQDLELSKSTVVEVQKRLERDTRELRTLMEIKLKDLREEKDKEISIRDEKLNKLKKQMADALKGNSWERQQQLDELTKELGRVQDEADSLRFKIKAFQKSKGGACANCDTAQTQLTLTQRAVQDRDESIKELKMLCTKFEKQLTQQDKLLRQFAEQNVHKVTTVPK